MKKAVLNTLILVCICGVMALLLAVTNLITAPIIEANQQAAANEALLVVMPEGEFDADAKMDLTDYKLPATVTDVYREKNGGFVIQLKTAGYGSDLIIMCGVNAESVVTGAVCLSSTETLGYEQTYGESFVGKDAAGAAAVDTVAGGTKTTAAYKAAIADALQAVAILRGEAEGVRDLQEELAAALPAADGKFTKLFIAEVIEGVDAVYAADNGSGYVYIVGEELIPVDKSGTTDSEIVAAAHAILKASAAEAIDLTVFENLPKALKSAEKTATGNYILTLEAAGYALTGEHYYGTAAPIVIRVSMTAEGKIIDTLTVSQAESPKYGEACGDEAFYGQFDGKTESDYSDVDAITGATVTTNAYLLAIQRAFESVKILEGGSN